MPNDQQPSDAEICALYQRGLSQATVARQLHVKKSFVRGVLVASGVEMRPHNALSPACLAEIDLQLATTAARYMRGDSLVAIKRRVRLSTARIEGAVHRFGGELRTQHAVTAEDKAERRKARIARSLARRAKKRASGVSGKRTTKVDVARLRKLYEDDRLPMTKVANELGVSYGCVWWLMKRHNILVRVREVRCA